MKIDAAAPPDLAVGSAESALPASDQLLAGSGVTFHLFVDSAEGVAISLDSEEISELADAAEAWLEDNPAEIHE
jgi:hypothetical protein